MPSDTVRTFPFRFDRRYRPAALAFGVVPGSAAVTLDQGRLVATFGPWTVDTPLANVAGTEVTGPYSFLKTVGPAHLSFKDRGLTFATNGERGLCIRFHEPVTGISAVGPLRHPALTVTVEDVDGLREALTVGV